MATKDASKKDSSKLADLLFPTQEEQEVAESVLDIAPEQRRLHTETYDFNVATLAQMMKTDHLFVPEFQRRYVWSEGQASRLIESLIIQCPIPVIYLNQEADEKLAVIDGNQRLNSIQRYLNNMFPLRLLTAYPELQGLRYSELDKRFQRHIENRTLRCIVIMKDTHPQVKFDVFERLNTGSVKLTSQEVRHGIYHGPFMKLIEKLAQRKDLAELLEIRNDKRMKTEELVIRFFAFHYNLSKYSKPLVGFLNDFANQHRALKDGVDAEFTALLDRTVKAVHKMFGKHAFKIIDQDLTIYSRFNAALFDAEMVAVSSSDLTPDQITKAHQKYVLGRLGKDFMEDDDFIKSVTQATSDDQQVKRRISHLKKLIAAATAA